MIEWEEVKLGDIAYLQYGKSLVQNMRVISGKVPVYSSSGVTGYHNEAITEAPVIVIGRKGNIGTVFLSDVPIWPIDTVFFTYGSSQTDIVFLYYLLQTLGLEQMNSDSAVPGLNRNRAHSLDVMLPPLPEQRAIAQMLGSLDDKIEANRRENETLEATARAIFKSWFVDFDPVHAKSRGEIPAGMDEQTAQLFPDAFVESELGLIPQGWEVGTLGDVAENFDSKRIPLSKRQREQRESIYPYYGATSIMDYVDDYLFDGIYLLMAEDGSVRNDKGNPVLQYVWGKFWVNNHAHVLQGKKGFNVEQLYLILQTTQVDPFITGAVQLKINQSNMNQIPVVLAPYDINSAFQKAIAPLFIKMRSGYDMINTLAETRDALLPKLMSGEVRVGDTTRDSNASIL